MPNWTKVKEEIDKLWAITLDVVLTK
jgi:hypothetical protein